MKINHLHLTGPPRELGRAHGEALRNEIGQLLQVVHGMAAYFGVKDPRAFMDSLVSDTGFLRAANLYTPRLVDEVRGIAEGVNQQPSTFPFPPAAKRWAL